MNRLPDYANLVPRRHTVYAAILLGGCAVILAVGGLFAAAQQLSPHTTDGTVSAFDLDSEGSIACWLSVIAYFMSGLTTLLIRNLRLTRCASVKEGRAWLALAALWFTMSLDEGASLHEGFKELMVLLTGTRVHGDGSVYWVVPYFLALTSAGLFLLWRARRVPLAIACLLAAGVSFAVAVAGQLDIILSGQPLLETWVEETGEMTGQLCILLSLGLYARSVAHGAEHSWSQTSRSVSVRTLAREGAGRPAARSCP